MALDPHLHDARVANLLAMRDLLLTESQNNLALGIHHMPEARADCSDVAVVPLGADDGDPGGPATRRGSELGLDGAVGQVEVGTHAGAPQIGDEAEGGVALRLVEESARSSSR